ncbi:epoxyqueuosine reductase QueH [Candidatus Schmidhempelia bombi]|uniref:Epoxyqueuosine reductase QueH n=1 Tax=Candidatus Schmidhempelia bombi str. Bimp TaxID=1387197 RepID=A0AB94IDG3_9GAMM|nr:epoxyqueuosine reductase QueH [Candidatus Schmidhempelia bombi]TEA27505.1 epoxyqueuosine reductase QueH [Candidatus Schmidhempelia bombi str. Bimp]
MFINATDILEKLNPHNKINYDAVLQQVIKNWQTLPQKPKLLIHSCCAPCSTYVLEYLAQYAEITIYFANSNIHPRVEYEYRSQVQQKFIRDFNQKTGYQVQFLEAPYQPAEFIKNVEHLRDEPEGGARCHICYKMRLDLAAIKAQELGFDYFASALTLSPKKNSKKINELGMDMQELFAVKYLPSDFKKNNGYKRSVEICKEYDVYRQCYCGCIFAAKEQGIDFKAVIKHAKVGLAMIETKEVQ